MRSPGPTPTPTPPTDPPGSGVGFAFCCPPASLVSAAPHRLYKHASPVASGAGLAFGNKNVHYNASFDPSTRKRDDNVLEKGWAAGGAMEMSTTEGERTAEGSCALESVCSSLLKPTPPVNVASK